MSSRTSHLNKQGETESEGYEAGSHNKKADWLRGGHNRDDKEKKPTVAARGISETSGAVEDIDEDDLATVHLMPQTMHPETEIRRLREGKSPCPVFTTLDDETPACDFAFGVRLNHVGAEIIAVRPTRDPLVCPQSGFCGS